MLAIRSLPALADVALFTLTFFPMPKPDNGSHITGYFVPSTPDTPPSKSVSERLWRLARMHTVAVAAITVLAILVGAAYAAIADRVYRSEAVLVPIVDQESAEALGSLTSQFGGLASLMGVNLDTDSAKREALATLRSRAFILKFVRDRQLLPVLFADRWNESSGTWNLRWPQSEPTDQDAYRAMDRSIMRITEDTTSGLIRLRIDWRDPAVAADWANDLVRRGNEQLRARAVEDAQKSLAFLERELSKTNVVELRQAIHRIQETQIRRVMLANVREEYAFKVIDPAISPDSDDYVKPNVQLVLILAFVFGLSIGLAFAAFVDARQARRGRKAG